MGEYREFPYISVPTHEQNPQRLPSTPQRFTVYTVCVSCLVVSDSLQPHRLQPTRPLHPWGSPGKNTVVGCHFLLQKEL